MASAAVATWTACVTGLQKFVGNAITAPECSLLMLNISKLSTLGFPLPQAAVKRLVHDCQVTGPLAAVCVQAYQQNTSLLVKDVVTFVLGLWLYEAQSACAASPQSRLAASVRQQLQESGLMQHMAAMLTDAAECLRAAATTAAAYQAAGSISSSSSSSSRGAQEDAQKCLKAVVLVQEVLQVFGRSCEVLSTEATFSLESALHAAPAAVRLILTAFQTCSRLQQLAGAESRPAPEGLLVSDAEYQSTCAASLGTAHYVLLQLAGAVGWHTTQGSLLSLPGVQELLLCPELVPSFAVGVLVAVLELDTGAQLQGAASSSSLLSAAADNQAGGTASSSSSSNRSNRSSRAGSRGSGQAFNGQGSSQQPAGSGSASTRRNPSSSTSSSGRLGNGISLDSLTPLSRGLFGLLGVDQGVLLQAVKGAHDLQGRFTSSYVERLTNTYNYLLKHQVQQLSTPSASHAQLLLHAETDMLLTLAVHQLTASIPDSYPGAHEAHKAVCDRPCFLMYILSATSSLHKGLPLPSAYTGPQLALQVTPCALGQPAPEEQQQEPPQCQWYTMTPTNQLLAELLPLLSSYGLATLQRQHQQRQQLLQGLQLEQGGVHRQAPGAPGSSVHAPADLLSIAKSLTNSVCPQSVKMCMSRVYKLLRYAVIPHPSLTSAEKQAALADASTWRYAAGLFPYRCGVQAYDTVLQNAGDILQLCETLLRDCADMCAAAAQLRNAQGVAASTFTQQLTASVLVSAEDSLFWIANFVEGLVLHSVTDGLPHHPSALAAAALSAGPGSALQQQLSSLLCSMLKLGRAPIAADLPQSTADNSLKARGCLSRAAAITAASLVAGAGDMQQPGLPEVAGAHAAVVSQLPALFILGRSCMHWAQDSSRLGLDAFPSLVAAHEAMQQPTVAEHVLPAVQQWLQASRTQEQLVAAGYAPQALPQQLQQVMVALQAVRLEALQGSVDASSSNFDTTLFEEAAQQLQAAGKALCSFAVPCLCNNPSCANLSGLTEVGLESGRSCICAGCRVARYCGRACQRAAWKQHKPVCAALAAAAASTAAGAAVSAPPAGP